MSIGAFAEFSFKYSKSCWEETLTSSFNKGSGVLLEHAANTNTKLALIITFLNFISSPAKQGLNSHIFKKQTTLYRPKMGHKN
jgi:hypothetical protein